MGLQHTDEDGLRGALVTGLGELPDGRARLQLPGGLLFKTRGVRPGPTQRRVGVPPPPGGYRPYKKARSRYAALASPGGGGGGREQRGAANGVGGGGNGSTEARSQPPPLQSVLPDPIHVRLIRDCGWQRKSMAVGSWRDFARGTFGSVYEKEKEYGIVTCSRNQLHCFLLLNFVVERRRSASAADRCRGRGPRFAARAPIATGRRTPGPSPGAEWGGGCGGREKAGKERHENANPLRDPPPPLGPSDLPDELRALGLQGAVAPLQIRSRRCRRLRRG